MIFTTQDGKKIVDSDYKCLKFHLKFIRKMTIPDSVPLKRVNKSMNRSFFLPIRLDLRAGHQTVFGQGIPFMLCVLLGQITKCCANGFQDLAFSLASICTLSFISKLNAESI